MTALVEVSAPQAASVAPRRNTFAKLVRRPMGAIGLAMLVIAVLVAIFAPLLAPYDPYANVRVTIFDIFQPPSGAQASMKFFNEPSMASSRVAPQLPADPVVPISVPWS